MTKLSIAKFKASDLAEVKLRDSVRAMAERFDPEAMARTCETAGPAMTIRSPEGEVICCLGIKTFWSGVGEAWAVFSTDAVKYPSAWRKVKQIFELAFTKFGYHRIQAVISVADETAIRMDERLGFKHECIMKGYGPDGSDYCLMAMVR